MAGMNRGPWPDMKGVKCVVLCAGRGSRMNPLTAEMPKVLTVVNGRPLIHYVINYWRRFTDEFVFIVGYRKEMVIDYILKEPINASFVEQVERKGIADAVMHAEGSVGEKFVLILGDCICSGSFGFSDAMQQGIGVWVAENEQTIRQSYSVEMQDGLVKKVVEKPSLMVNNLCGMGFYFFDKGVFGYIRQTPPSSLRNEVEITDVIQRMIDSGEEMKPVYFEGDYINVTTPEDIERAAGILK